MKLDKTSLALCIFIGAGSLFLLLRPDTDSKPEQNEDLDVNTSTVITRHPPSPAHQVADSTERNIRLKSAGEQTEYELNIAADHATVFGKSNEELSIVKIGDQFQVRRALDNHVGEILMTPRGINVIDPTTGQDFEFIKLRESNDWKLSDKEGETVYRVKQRSYGFEIELPDNQSLFKIKHKDKKKSLRDAGEITLLYTKDEVTTVALVPLGFRQVISEDLCIAMMVVLSGQTLR